MEQFKNIKITTMSGLDIVNVAQNEKNQNTSIVVLASSFAVIMGIGFIVQIRSGDRSGMATLIGVGLAGFISIAIVWWVLRKANRMLQLQPGDIWRSRALDKGSNYGGAFIVRPTTMTFEPIRMMLSEPAYALTRYELPIANIKSIEFGGFVWGGPYGRRLQAISIASQDNVTHLICIKNYASFYKLVTEGNQ